MDIRKRIPELDGLRALMIFIVSWYHIWQQSWLGPRVGRFSLDFLVRSGYVWVDGTVLLSSFLLFLPYARARRDGTPLPDTRDFYRRRARRILPSYYFILLLVFFAICLPWDLYRGNGPWLVKDLATHFTFTFPFFYDTLIATPLGAASWTLAIEVQAYALFPLIARGAVKKPALTLGLLCAVCFGFRAWCLWALDDYAMVVNQLPNFLDVYAAGMGLAALHARLERADAGAGRMRKLLFTALFFGALGGLEYMLRLQARSPGYAEIQRAQMIYRPVFALLFGTLILCCGRAVMPLRRLLGNRVTHFLAGISMNYYLIHQTIIVHMRRIGFPPSESEHPNTAGEQPWQNRYTLLAFGLSLAAAALITCLVEKPAARFLARRADAKKGSG